MTREQWLIDVAQAIAPMITGVTGEALPTYRVSVGFTSKGARSNRIGECWSQRSSADGVCEVFIVPTMDDPVEVAAILAHELIHVAVGTEEGHGKRFGKVARAIGLEGKLTATYAGPELLGRLDVIIRKVGPMPHGKLVAGQGASSTPKKQSTRMLKAECDCCGLTFRITKKWSEDRHLTCPDATCDGTMRVESNDSEGE